MSAAVRELSRHTWDCEEQIPLPFPAKAPLHPPEPVDINRPNDAFINRCARFMQAMCEIITGGRPARQLGPWLAPGVYRELAHHMSLSVKRGRAPAGHSGRIASVHVALIYESVAEVTARMVHQGRSRAMAARLERVTTIKGETLWQCTAFVWA